MNYYEEIKSELVNNEIYKKAKDYSKNKSDLITYYNVGKLLIEAQGGEARAKYGDELIKEYSKKLLLEEIVAPLVQQFIMESLFNVTTIKRYK